MRRVVVFDELRGFMLVNVILYHLFFDLTHLFGFDISWYQSQAINFWQEIISCSLIFISGACSYYSKNNLKRGIRILFYAVMLTLVTYIFIPDMLVIFGILHCLGISMVIFSFIQKWIHKVSVPIGILISLLLFVVTLDISKGYIGIFNWIQLAIPRSLYLTDYLFIFGFHSTNFVSSDYFPLLPYFFMFVAGSYLGSLGLSNYLPEFVYNTHLKPLEYIGKNSLWIYLIHQPIIYAVIWLIIAVGSKT